MLAKHPDVAMMFQPTNSTEVHKDLFRIWDVNELHEETAKFYEEAAERRVYRDYIKAQWFDMYSSLDNLATAKLLVIKETKLFFKLDWMWENLFCVADVYGIWRSPFEITNSIVRNNFHIDWYGPERAYKEVVREVRSHNILTATYAPLMNEVVDKVSMMAYVISVALYMLLQGLPDKVCWLDFELIKTDPNKYLNEFLAKFGIDKFDFTEYHDNDYNVSGSNFKKSPSWEEFFSSKEKDTIKTILDPVLELADDLGLTIN